MKEELAKRAPKLFPKLFPDAWKHGERKWEGEWYEGTPLLSKGKWVCSKCGSNNRLIPCTVPDPIVIDWNVAMKLRDEMRNSKIWNDACYEVWKNYTEKAVTQEVFWRDYAIPKHYIEAACVAKEAENGN